MGESDFGDREELWGRHDTWVVPYIFLLGNDSVISLCGIHGIEENYGESIDLR